jgi:hypothetical protein
MATLRLLSFAEVTGLTNGAKREFGNKGVFAEFTPTNGEFYEAAAIVADGYTEVALWDTTEGGLATFNYALIYSDKDITVQVSDGSVDNVFSVPAGLVMAFGGKTITTFGGSASEDTMTDLDNITAKRNVADGSGDAFVNLMLVG